VQAEGREEKGRILMAKVDFTVTRYAKGMSAGTIRSSHVRLSGQDTITTVENLEDASGDITLASGDVIAIHTDIAIRVRFGGVAATSTTGHYIPATMLVEIECEDPGAVSVVEAA
jgi:hypothetical protein